MPIIPEADLSQKFISTTGNIYAAMSSIYNYWYPPEPTYAERALAFIQYPFTLVGNPLKVFTSIPALSFLIIPAFSSYTTTLQLFFFYLTWATLILSNPPLKVELYGTLAIRLLFYVVPSLFFLAFDSAVPSAAASIKQYGDIALPMSEEQGGVRGRWWKIGLISIGNVLLGVLIQGAIAYFFVEVLHIRSALKITTSLPMPWGIVIDLFRGLFLREVSLRAFASPPQRTSTNIVPSYSLMSCIATSCITRLLHSLRTMKLGIIALQLHTPSLLITTTHWHIYFTSFCQLTCQQPFAISTFSPTICT